MAKILHGLRGKRLVRSTRGPGGGYELARPASDITVVEVIEAVDGPDDGLPFIMLFAGVPEPITLGFLGLGGLGVLRRRRAKSRRMTY